MFKFFILVISLIISQTLYSESDFRAKILSEATDLPNSCISGLIAKAQDSGLSSSIIANVIPSLKHLPQVIKYDRSQPEFTQTFSSYIEKRVSPYRIKEGKKLFNKHQQFLKTLTQKYGIPGRYLIAFWGLETNFGSYLGKMPILDSLATLSCDQRRSEFFTSELILALKLVERESLKINDMQGSWAGAMGHTQFMPSTYYQYAIDGDKDGHINLFNSEQDALASGANFLSQLGWKVGERWGREVLLPKNFAYQQTGLKNWSSLRDWNSLGLTKVNGQPLPDIDMKASVLVPAGH
ncbi:MAG: lytic murein transglycosylase, partial [Gammaproteobacteria bacterium]|nr:lytic murein transglycosylase [Gammaproteobacteria bacterium]